MKQEELAKILEEHRKWLNGEGGSFADLSYADLRSADLRSVDLRSADLRFANLRFADLSYADLSSANLSSANLSFADLSYADLSSADLSFANLSELEIRRRQIVPETGEFTAWKKLFGAAICELRVTANAKRLGGLTERKCRVSEAVVVRITSADGERIDMGYSNHNHAFIYRVGETVEAEDFCDDPRKVCAPGIHCFITRIEAEEW